MPWCNEAITVTRHSVKYSPTRLVYNFNHTKIRLIIVRTVTLYTNNTASAKRTAVGNIWCNNVFSKGIYDECGEQECCEVGGQWYTRIPEEDRPICLDLDMRIVRTPLWTWGGDRGETVNIFLLNHTKSVVLNLFTFMQLIPISLLQTLDLQIWYYCPSFWWSKSALSFLFFCYILCFLKYIFNLSSFLSVSYIFKYVKVQHI